MIYRPRPLSFLKPAPHLPCESDQRVDLLFTDVVLPGRAGKALADELAIARLFT
jgi:hypothetical protein